MLFLPVFFFRSPKSETSKDFTNEKLADYNNTPDVQYVLLPAPPRRFSSRGGYVDSKRLR